MQQKEVQFLEVAGRKDRLVVMPEDLYKMLSRAAEKMASTSALDRAETADGGVPAEVRFALSEGANPVATLRKWRGMSARRLASLSGITPSMVCQIERYGKHGSTRTVRAIATVLDVPIELLFMESWKKAA